MIYLHVLGSGSKGNAFAIASPDGVVLIDAGFSAKEVFRRAEVSGLALERVVGIAVTHEHGDHSTGACRLARLLNAPIIATPGTLRAIGAEQADVKRIPLHTSSLVEIGPCTVGASRTLHDANEPAAITIECAGVRVGLAYDFGKATAGLRYLLRDLDAVIVESNYDDVMLRTSSYPVSVQHRIAGSAGHLSNRGAAELLGDLVHDGLSVVVLAHLSQQCNAPEVARSTVEPALRRAGFTGHLAVALQDEPLSPIPVRAGLRRANSQVELVFGLSEPDKPAV